VDERSQSEFSWVWMEGPLDLSRTLGGLGANRGKLEVENLGNENVGRWRVHHLVCNMYCLHSKCWDEKTQEIIVKIVKIGGDRKTE
jgi:hypothetical protein